MSDPKAALDRIERYIAMRDAKPLRGAGDSIHGIHIGTEYEAELSLPDVAALAVVARAYLATASQEPAPVAWADWRAVEALQKRTASGSIYMARERSDAYNCPLYAAPLPPVVGEDARHEFKNFHRLLCERFGYCHDEKDWQRDQISLIEHIAVLTSSAPMGFAALLKDVLSYLEGGYPGVTSGGQKNIDLRSRILAALPALSASSVAKPCGVKGADEDDGRQLAHRLADIARSLLSRPPELRGPFQTNEEALRRVAALPPKTAKPKIDVRQAIRDIEDGKSHGFLNDGTSDPTHDLNCPYCGGSGHKDDALSHPAQGWREIASAPNGQEVLIAYWRWRNSMSPGAIIVQSAMRTELHGPGIWSWVVSDNKHGPFPIRGWSDGDIIGWMPLPTAPAGGSDE